MFGKYKNHHCLIGHLYAHPSARVHPWSGLLVCWSETDLLRHEPAQVLLHGHGRQVCCQLQGIQDRHSVTLCDHLHLLRPVISGLTGHVAICCVGLVFLPIPCSAPVILVCSVTWKTINPKTSIPMMTWKRASLTSLNALVLPLSLAPVLMT